MQTRLVDHFTPASDRDVSLLPISPRLSSAAPSAFGHTGNPTPSLSLYFRGANNVIPTTLKGGVIQPIAPAAVHDLPPIPLTASASSSSAIDFHSGPPSSAFNPSSGGGSAPHKVSGSESEYVPFFLPPQNVCGFMGRMMMMCVVAGGLRRPVLCSRANDQLHHRFILRTGRLSFASSSSRSVHELSVSFF